jgi:CheY-like chemotaxis protein
MCATQERGDRSPDRHDMSLGAHGREASMDRPLCLLMVENTDDDAELLLRALRRGGYEVACEVVETPAAMCAALERQEWAVITSDHAMPHFSAPAALALAKALRPDVPFIVVSGELDLNLAVSLMKGGAQDQTASEHYLPPWGMKPTVLEQRNLLDLRTLILAH